MNTRLLTFTTVAKRKSFTIAAKELHLTQPAVTMQINSLEDFYGVQLFQRDNKEVKLTRDGEILYQYAKQIVDLYLLAKETFITQRRNIEGKVTIGAGYTTCEYILPQVIILLKKQIPKVEVIVHNGNYEQVVSSLQSGDVDVAFIAGECNIKHMDSVSLFTDELVLIVSNNHPFSQRDSISIEELKTEKFVLREQTSTTYIVLEAALDKVGFQLEDLQIIAQVDSHETIKNLVQSNYGISFISKWLIQKEIKLNYLQIVKVDRLHVYRDFNIVHPKVTRSKEVRQLIRLCLDYNWGSV